MASSFNAKCVHKDGKTELKIGVDENAKIIDADGKTIQFKNTDGSNAKIDKNNIVGMPDNVSETNKLITHDDLKNVMKEVIDIIDSAKTLAKILGIEIDDSKEE